MREVIENKDAAIDEFIERMRCVPGILAALNARCGRQLDEHLLADVVQDVLIVVWSKLPEFQGTGRLELWVYRICQFELMNAPAEEDAPAANHGAGAGGLDRRRARAE